MKTLDDLHELIASFMKAMSSDMGIIRSFAYESGNEIGLLKDAFSRHKSDVFQKISENSEKLRALEKKIDTVTEKINLLELDNPTTEYLLVNGKSK